MESVKKNCIKNEERNEEKEYNEKVFEEIKKILKKNDKKYTDSEKKNNIKTIFIKSFEKK